MEEAGTVLENAGEETITQSEKLENSEFQNGGVDFETTTINGYLDAASSELNQAEEYANEEQQERIEIARGYISFLDKAIEFLDVFTEGYSQAYTGFTYFQSSRYEDAVNQLKTAESTVSEADDLLTVTQSRAEELNTERLSEVESVQIQSVRSKFDTMDEFVPALQTLTEGLISVSEGMIDYTEAQSHLENEQLSDAEEGFRAAADDFNAARSAFRGEEESAPTELKSTFIEMSCYAEATRDGSTHLANSVEATQNGNRDRAESEADAAREDFNRCDFSQGSGSQNTATALTA